MSILLVVREIWEKNKKKPKKRIFIYIVPLRNMYPEIRYIFTYMEILLTMVNKFERLLSNGVIFFV